MILASTMSFVCIILVIVAVSLGAFAISIENPIPAIPTIVLFTILSKQDDRIAYEADYWKIEARDTLVKECPMDSSSAQCMLKWRDYRKDSTTVMDSFNKMMEKK